MAIRSLFVTSEMADFIKAGGLGDVAASLPRALHHRGMDIRILIPAYPAVLAAASSMELVGDLPGLAEIPSCRIGRFRTADGSVVYVVIAHDLYEREGSPYCRPDGTDWPDNDLRFARLSLAAAQIAGAAPSLATGCVARERLARWSCACVFALGVRRGCRACSPSTTSHTKACCDRSLQAALGIP